MSSSTIYVSADTDSGTVPVGVLYLTERSGSVSGVFSYDTEWLARAGAYALDPGLPLVSGAQAFSRALPGAISDSAPDRWGRQLIRKSEQLNSGTSLTPTLGLRINETRHLQQSTHGPYRPVLDMAVMQID